MKLRALASSVCGGDVRFGQLCLSGMVINVPTDLARIQVQLPHKFSTVDDTVTMNLKRSCAIRRIMLSRTFGRLRLYRHCST
jgi:hypothetical protein